MRTYKQQVNAVEDRLAAHCEKRRKQIKYLYVATSAFIITVAVIAASVVIKYYNNDIYVLKNKNDYMANYEKDEDQALTEGQSGTADELVSDSSFSGTASDIDIITSTTFYGKITESKRKDSEIKQMSGEKCGSLIAYEDKQYIYFFYQSGALHSILNTSEQHTEQYLEADNESIKPYAANFIKRYFPDFNESNYSVKVDHSQNAFPAWDLTYTIKDNGITTEKIIIRFIDNGDMYYLQRQSCDGNASISVKKAVDIALKNLNETYKLDIQKAAERYDISAFIAENDDNLVYNVEVSGIPVKYGDFETQKSYWIEISASSGAVLNIYQSK